MVSYKVKVSRQEQKLLDTIRAIGYGELFGVEIDDAPKEINLDVSMNCQDLIEMIRNGAQHIDVLTIHQGEPVMAETDYKDNGFRCRKKTKFPTE